jgi:DNA-directed RNA polymerase specialized sigma24 family protein
LDGPAAYLRSTIVNGCQRWHHDQSRRAEKQQLLPVTADDPAPAGCGRDVVDIAAKPRYRQRLVIVGRYWGGWSESEIAEVMGCPPGTAKSLAAGVLDSIRREIGQR